MNKTERRKEQAPAPEGSPLDEVGGEPLAGSGFEKETPEPEFTAPALNPDQA